MLTPMVVKIIPITIMIATQLMTWMVMMARFAILVPIKSSPVHVGRIFEAMRTDRVFTVDCRPSRGMTLSVNRLLTDRSVEIGTPTDKYGAGDEINDSKIRVSTIGRFVRLAFGTACQGLIFL
jgi:hypothetical protein